MHLRGRWAASPPPPHSLAGRAVVGGRISRRALDGKNVGLIIILALLGVVALLTFFTYVYRVRRTRARIPGAKQATKKSFFKRLWSEWRVPSGSGSRPSRYEQASSDDHPDVASTGHNRRGSEAPLTQAQTNSSATPTTNSTTTSNTTAANSRVDRNASIRSIMTLPAYRQKASNTEQVLGREGERDGVDVVVEAPTEEELEAMREEEMDALYNIRLARRQDIAEREERRRLRREARQRNDVVALEQIRQQTRQAAGATTVIEDLRTEHQRIKDQRQRTVSSVSYAELGIVHHDGTRVRANSTESERIGLLSDAASFAASTRSRDARSSLTSLTGPPTGHRRDRSASSVVSIDSDLPSPGRVRFRADSRPDTPRLGSSSHTRAGSSPEIIEADVGESDMPPHSPPGYDDVSLDDFPRSGATTPHTEPPPEYPGPAAARAEAVAAAARAATTSPAEESERRGRSPEQQQSARPGEVRRASRGVGGVPQLPSLRLSALPQIVIEPSSARPRDDR